MNKDGRNFATVTVSHMQIHAWFPAKGSEIN